MKGKVGGLLLAPLIAAGTSVAASFLVKKAPQFVEDTLVPWLRQVAEDALEGAGGVTETIPDKARSAVSSGGDLAEQLTDKVRDATGLGGSSGGSSNGLSPDELTQRSDDRAKRREKRRKATKKK